MSNKMQRYTVYFIWKLRLYLKYLVFVTPLLLPAAIAAGSSSSGGTTQNM